MLFHLVFRRMWRDRQLTIVLLIAVCLVTGFMAVGPLYAQAIVATEFGARLEQKGDGALLVDWRTNSPLDSETTAAAQDSLGPFFAGAEYFQRAERIFCGFQYVAGQTAEGYEPTELQMCYRPFAYKDFHAHFNMVDGQAPVNLVAGEREYVEAVVSRETADIASVKLL